MDRDWNEDRRRLAISIEAQVSSLTATYNSRVGESMTVVEMTLFVEAMNKLVDVAKNLRKGVKV